MNIINHRTHLPVLYNCDVAVIGGSLAGIAAALELSLRGKSVTLIESRTYLAEDVTATLRPWIPVESGNDPSRYPKVIATSIQASRTSALAGEFPLHIGAVKSSLEDLLANAGVNLLYASLPVGLCSQDERIEGVIIGNKSGRQVIACKVLLDATQTGLGVRLAGAHLEEPVAKPTLYSITLEFDRVFYQENDNMLEGGGKIEIPTEMGTPVEEVISHRGYRPGTSGYFHEHQYFECKMKLPGPLYTPAAITERYLNGRKIAFAVASHLLWQDPCFRLAYLASISSELYGPQTAKMADPLPEWSLPFEGRVIDDATGIHIPIRDCAAPLMGVWCLNEAVRVDTPYQDLWGNPIQSSHIGSAMGEAIADNWSKIVDQPAKTSKKVNPQSHNQSMTAQGTLQIKEQELPQRGQKYPLMPVEPVEIPVMDEVDVLVIGGGTSGAIATISAASEGMKTLVVEMNPGLGGTATFGGVHDYWAGWQKGFPAQSIGWVNKIHDQIRYPRTYGLVGEWNIEAKIHALSEAAQKAGAGLLFNALVIGAIMDGSAVRGVVVATSFGAVALLGKVIIDATGDGDVAAYAGAKFMYGSARDHAVMWYSLPQYTQPGITQNNFTSMVDITNILDYRRAILSGRRRGGALHDHGTYVATRESRHIVGDVVQTLTDQLLHRCWPDVINIAVSNNDIKGQISSDWMRIGLIPPNMEIENSYGTLLPLGLDNILVVGKAVSAEREALPAIRMQADFENLGGSAGLAAAMAVRSGKDLRSIDIRALQERLVKCGSLPQKILTRRLVPWQPAENDLKRSIDDLVAYDHPLHTYSKMELNEVYYERLPIVDVCAAGPEAIPLLEEALEKTSGQGQVKIAQALAMLGSKSGVSVLIKTIEKQLVGKTLPERVEYIQNVDKFSPDQAAMPDAAYLIYSLALARDERSLPILRQVGDALGAAAEADIWSQAKGIFCYVDAVCYAAELLGSPEAAPILKKLHDYPIFHGQVLVQGYQADYLKERQAYLEVVIGRALARCGNPEGVVVLINYLKDVRGLLAEQAHDELKAISGQDFGKDQSAWSHWLEAEGDSLKPTPWATPSDAMAAWVKNYLTEGY